jgi:hypothetical protein
MPFAWCSLQVFGEGRFALARGESTPEIEVNVTLGASVVRRSIDRGA